MKKASPCGEAPPHKQEHIVCIHNVSGQDQGFQADMGELGVPYSGALEDLVTGERHPVDEYGQLHRTIAPYQVLWLKV